MINRRKTLIGTMVATPIVAAATLSAATTFGLATPTTTTTTTSPAIPPVIVLPTTAPPPPTPPTTPTTTARPSTPATTTAQTVPPIVVQQSAPTTAAVDDLGPTPTTAALPVALPTTSTSSVPPTAEEDIVLGELSFDPTEWPADVVDFLQAEGVDVDQLPVGAAPHGQPGGLLSNEGCAVQCVTYGVAYPVGTGAHVKVVTAVPATIRISVFGAAANATSPTSATTWGHTWPNLNGNTTYVALVKAEDAAGNESFASGEFTTLTRFAQVELYDFQAAAQLPYEHFHASVWIDDELHGVFYADDVDPLAIDVGTADAALEVVVEVTLHDHDNDCLVQAANGAPPDDGGGSNCNSVWGVASIVSELDIYPAQATYWTEHTIDATVSTPLGLVEFDDAPPVPFVAQLRIDVTYEYP